MKNPLNSILVYSLLVCYSCSEPALPITEDATFVKGVNNGLIENESLNQASGIIASRTNERILWHHNDGTSPNKQLLFATDYNGKNVKQFVLNKYFNRDWEDIAIVGDQNEATIYIGDIGDNSHVHSLKYIYTFKEPQIDPNAPNNVVIDKVEKIAFQYSDGIKYDSECLMVDQSTKDIYVITKSDLLDPKSTSNLFKIKYPQSTKQINTAEFVLTVPFSTVTGGDISADNSEILIRTYLEVFYTKLRPNESIKDSFRRNFSNLPYLFEPQGEAICFEATPKPNYFTTSDSQVPKVPNLYFYKRN